MTLLLNNDEIESVLTMKECMDSLRNLYKELGQEVSGAFPRQDVHMLTNQRDEYPNSPVAHYMKTMGGSSDEFGVTAVRMSSDIVAFPMINDRIRRVKLPAAPGGKFLGLILLYSSNNGELLSIMNDGFLSRMRVGATNGLAADYLARKDANIVGLLGSGWQAGAQIMALKEVRDINKVKVFSPTKSNREAFCREMAEQLKIEFIPKETAEEAVKGTDVIVTATNARQPFVFKEMIEPGMHISSLQRNEVEMNIYNTVDSLVLHTHAIEGNFTSKKLAQYETEEFKIKVHPLAFDMDWGKYPTLQDLAVGNIKGRESSGQITAFLNKLGHGSQFAAVAGKVYNLAKAAGLGKELPTEYFLQDIHP